MTEREEKKVQETTDDIMLEIERWEDGKLRTDQLKDRIFSIVRDILRD